MSELEKRFNDFFRSTKGLLVAIAIIGHPTHMENGYNLVYVLRCRSWQGAGQ